MAKRDWQLRRYYRQIRKLLPCTGRVKRRIVGEISDGIERYLADNPGADYPMVVEKFGTPQQIAFTCVDEMDTTVLLNGLQIKKRIFTSILCGIMAAVAIWLVFAGVALMHNFAQIDGNIKITITEEYIP